MYEGHQLIIHFALSHVEWPTASSIVEQISYADKGCCLDMVCYRMHVDLELDHS